MRGISIRRDQYESSNNVGFSCNQILSLLEWHRINCDGILIYIFIYTLFILLKFVGWAGDHP